MSGYFTPDQVYREETVFTAAEADRKGRARPDALLYRFQTAAGDHYSSLGLGRKTAVERGCFWAVTRNDLRILRMPEVGERLWLDTWTGRHGHGLFWRHYRLQIPEGEVLLRGVSMWVVMDLAARTLSRDYAWAQNAPVVKQAGELPASFRGVDFPGDLPGRAERIVTPEETDENGHLNNTLYVPWGTDLLPEGFADSHALRSLWIEYRKELPEGQRAQLHFLLENDILYVKGFASEKECFSIKAEYV